MTGIRNRGGAFVLFFLDHFVLEIETLSDFAGMKMHRKCSCLTTVCYTFILGAALNFLSYLNLSVAHPFSGKGEGNLNMDAQMQLVLYSCSLERFLDLAKSL